MSKRGNDYTQTRLPEEGTLFIKRDEQGRLWVWQLRLSCLGAMERVSFEGTGRRVYKTPDGGVFTNARHAGEHMAKLDATEKLGGVG